MSTGSNPSSENIRLFRTITEVNEATAMAYLSRSSTITEALNDFFRSQDRTTTSSNPTIMRASTSVHPQSPAQTRLSPQVQRYSQSQSSTHVVPQSSSVRSNASKPGATSSSVAQASTSNARAMTPPPKKKQVKKKKTQEEVRQSMPPAQESKTSSKESSPEKEGTSAIGKRKFSEMISKYLKEDLNDEAKKKQWPKYLGSLKVQCQMLSTNTRRLKIGDVLSFKPNQIEFRENVTRKGNKIFTIRGTSLHVTTCFKDEAVGFLKCEYEEIFVFLLAMRYIILDGTVLTKPSDKHHKSKGDKRCDIRIDIFLTEEVIVNPLNVVTQPGRKVGEVNKSIKKNEEENQDEIPNAKKKNKKKNYEDELSDEEQKMHHISRLTKESFVKLFFFLQIKVSIPTVVQLKQRTDPFCAVRRDKYGGYRDFYNPDKFVVNCYEEKPELITEEHSLYFKRRNPVAPEGQPAPSSQDMASSLESVGSSAQADQMKEEAKKEDTTKKEKEEEEEELEEIEKRLLKKISAEIEMANNDMPGSQHLRSSRSQPRTGHKGGFERNESSDDDQLYMSDSSEDEGERGRRSSIGPTQVQNPSAVQGSRDFFNPFGGIQGASQSQEAQGGVKSHLNDLFNLHNQNSNFFSLSDPPSTFKSELHVYQKQALTWMKYREGCLDNQKLYDKLNEEIRLLNDLFEELILIDGSKIYFNPFNGEIMVDFPKSKPCRGGILADEMGLGKTVMTIALLHSHKRPEKPRESNSADEEEVEEKTVQSKKKLKKSFGSLAPEVSGNKKAGTLIVVPVTVLTQWETEILTHSNEDTIKVIQYYGQGRSKSIKTQIQDYDVVITSYGVLGSDYANQKEGKPSMGLFAFDWFRVILDEAHYIKGRGTRCAKAACTLNSEFRWCLTGTPLQNKLDDLFSIIRFLRLETWGEYFLWNTYINKDTQNDEAFELLRSILRPILLRRTKKSTYRDGRSILELPPKEVKTHMVSLTPEERQIYNSLFNGGKNQFDQIVTSGTLQYEYAHVFELLMRLRQVCNHPSLVFSKDDLKDGASLQEAIFRFLDKRATSSLLNARNPNSASTSQARIQAAAAPADEVEEEKKNQDDDPSLDGKRKKVGNISTEFLQETINRLQNKELGPCCVCLDEIMEPIITTCCHVFCKTCIFGAIEARGTCPICRKNLTTSDVMQVTLEDKEVFADLINVQGDKFKRSSKLNALFEHIHEIRDKKEKCVVFSQFLGMLNLIERCLKEEGIQYRVNYIFSPLICLKRIDGSCTLKQRSRFIDEFKTEEEVVVFLISLKAGAIGLNLTVANHAILVDPWWNPAVEDQAIERVHRIGQRKKVEVTRLICEKTIEARIIDLHEKKKGLVNMTLHFNPEEQKKQNMQNMVYIMRNFDDQ